MPCMLGLGLGFDRYDTVGESRVLLPCASDPTIRGDGQKCALPTLKENASHADLLCISPATLCDILDGKHDDVCGLVCAVQFLLRMRSEVCRLETTAYVGCARFSGLCCDFCCVCTCRLAVCSLCAT